MLKQVMESGKDGGANIKSKQENPATIGLYKLELKPAKAGNIKMILKHKYILPPYYLQWDYTHISTTFGAILDDRVLSEKTQKDESFGLSNFLTKFLFSTWKSLLNFFVFRQIQKNMDNAVSSNESVVAKVVPDGIAKKYKQGCCECHRFTHP
jgi:hypothetical protein